MMDKYAPWKVDVSEMTTAIWVEDSRGDVVCRLRNCDMDLDRAKLIARAPEMAAELAKLKAVNAQLVQALQAIDQATNGPWDGDEQIKYEARAWQLLRAALAAAKGERKMSNSTHRHIQLSQWADRASSERVRYYCNAIKAASINNHGAAQYFIALAQKWEKIRQAAVTRMLP